jgi:hypothetical protein
LEKIKKMQISVKDGEVYAKRSVNIGDVSIEVNILYPDKLSWNGVVNDELPIDFTSSHTRLGKMLNKAIADYLTESDEYVVCGMNKDGSLK